MLSAGQLAPGPESRCLQAELNEALEQARAERTAALEAEAEACRVKEEEAKAAEEAHEEEMARVGCGFFCRVPESASHWIWITCPCP